jgi:hypothetical protein
VCSSKRWTCRGGSSPRPRGGARGSISSTGSPCAHWRTPHWSPRAWSRQPPQPALTDLKEPRSAGRSTVRDAGAPSCTPVARRRSAPVYPLIGYLCGSLRPPARIWRTQDVDQCSPCPPAHGAQNAQIWTANVVTGIEPTPVQITAAPRAFSMTMRDGEEGRGLQPVAALGAWWGWRRAVTWSGLRYDWRPRPGGGPGLNLMPVMRCQSQARYQPGPARGQGRPDRPHRRARPEGRRRPTRGFDPLRRPDPGGQGRQQGGGLSRPAHLDRRLRRSFSGHLSGKRSPGQKERVNQRRRGRYA